jgi:hypothetical protein
MASSVKSEIRKTLEEIRERDRLLSRLITKLSREADIRKVASLNLQIRKEEQLIRELNAKVERLRIERSSSKSRSGSKSRSRSKSRSKSRSMSRGKTTGYKKDIWLGSRMFPTIKPGGKVVEPDPLEWSSYVLVPSILDGGKRKRKI